MTEIEKAIRAIEAALEAEPDIVFFGEPFHYIIDRAAQTALAVLRERAGREKGCEKCATDNAASFDSAIAAWNCLAADEMKGE